MPRRRSSRPATARSSSTARATPPPRRRSRWAAWPRSSTPATPRRCAGSARTSRPAESAACSSRAGRRCSPSSSPRGSPTSSSSRSHPSSSATRQPRGSSTTATTPGLLTAGRDSSRLACSTTSCCCATRSPTDSARNPEDPMPHHPIATIRNHVLLPMRLAEGFTTTARVFTFDGLVDGGEHLALGLGARAAAVASDPNDGPVPLVRLHSECLTGDLFGSQRCDCGPQLTEAVHQIAGAGGFLLYLRQEGRGIGLY